MNKIGLDTEKSKDLSGQLNQLLANYQVFYINARGFHWNITGDRFFELHAKFEELYNDLLVKVDEIAERILTLGNTPLHTFSDYTAIATIKEAKNISGGKEAMQSILDSFQSLLVLQRSIADAAGEAGDEGTAALMSDYIREQEKLVWMYSAYLK
ncbi:Dps family protein [Flaviaesturariibacter amylovorans]|uniref:Dps family protein n=1 Tax=Flaviaesturariibacter amylovorans TaxID=1084520 RepID=A0ABP8GMK2_9BACT